MGNHCIYIKITSLQEIIKIIRINPYQMPGFNYWLADTQTYLMFSNLFITFRANSYLQHIYSK